MSQDALVSIRDLHVDFASGKRRTKAVVGVSLDVEPGETIGIVGESGSGKTATVLASVRLIPQPPAEILHGEVWFDGRDLLSLGDAELQRVRGREIGVIFQDPMTYLNPVMTIGSQIGEALAVHDKALSRTGANAGAVDLLRRVGVPSPQVRAKQYPHEFSGGMRQRAIIAIAIANTPRLLIADEPTTALDVTVQAEILEIIVDAQSETGASSIFVTHDLGVIAEIADRVAVMYAGRIVEQASVDELFSAPAHPYTAALLGSIPHVATRGGRRLAPIAGAPPDLAETPSGCAFHPRCRIGALRTKCKHESPCLTAVATNHLTACHFSAEVYQQGHQPC